MVNVSTKPIDTLQPEITSPTNIPQNWHIIITDLQDCFRLQRKLVKIFFEIANQFFLHVQLGEG